MSEDAELFTTRMRKATRQIYSVSDALALNTKLAISLRDETVWGGGLFVFYHIFAFLEDAKERLNMPELNKMFMQKIMFRKKAFEEDLTHYLGEDWQSIPKSKALVNYLQHLKDLEKENPKMLLAHVYHLYLRLLSDGQILAKKRKMFGSNTPTEQNYVDQVTNFSEVDIRQLKKDFRQAMNEIANDLSEEEKNGLMEESNQVFLMNNLIVNSIGGQNQVLRNLLLKVSAVALVVVGAVMAYKMNK